MKCKFGHQAAPLGLVQMLVIRWRRLHKLQILSQGWVTCIAKLSWIALSVRFELISLSARVTSVKSSQDVVQTSQPKDWIPDILVMNFRKNYNIFSQNEGRRGGKNWLDQRSFRICSSEINPFCRVPRYRHPLDECHTVREAPT